MDGVYLFLSFFALRTVPDLRQKTIHLHSDTPSSLSTRSRGLPRRVASCNGFIGQLLANILGYHAQGRLQACWITPIAPSSTLYPLSGRNAADFFNDLIWLTFLFLVGFVTVYGMVGHLTLWRFSDSIPGGLGGDLAHRSWSYYPIEGWAALLRLVSAWKIDMEETRKSTLRQPLERIGPTTLRRMDNTSAS